MLAFLLILGQTASAVLLTEVLYNEPGSQTTKEWIEIYNPAATTIDLTGYTLTSSQNKTYTLQHNITNHTYVVVARKSDRFHEEWGFYPDLDGIKFTLKNSGDYVNLKYPNMSVCDQVQWITWNLTCQDNKSIARHTLNDTDTETDWICDQIPSPGWGNTKPPTTTSSSTSTSTSTTSSSTTIPRILFSEVFYDTPEKDSNEEWLELYNNDLLQVNITGYRIQDNKEEYTITDAVIQPDETYVIAKEEDGFKKLYGFQPDQTGLTLSLNNNGDILKLYTPDGRIIDLVSWESLYQDWQITAKTGESLQRHPIDRDRDLERDWVVSEEPTPGSDQTTPKPEPKKEKRRNEKTTTTTTTTLWRPKITTTTSTTTTTTITYNFTNPLRLYTTTTTTTTTSTTTTTLKATCADGIQNQFEEQTDCGGPNCQPCKDEEGMPTGAATAYAGGGITATILLTGLYLGGKIYKKWKR